MHLQYQFSLLYCDDYIFRHWTGPFAGVVMLRHPFYRSPELSAGNPCVMAQWYMPSIHHSISGVGCLSAKRIEALLFQMTKKSLRRGRKPRDYTITSISSFVISEHRDRRGKPSDPRQAPNRSHRRPPENRKEPPIAARPNNATIRRNRALFTPTAGDAGRPGCLLMGA